MSLFSFLKKKGKNGKRSNIAERSSPYLHKPSIPSRVAKRVKKRASLIIKPPTLQKGGKGKKLFILALGLLVIGIFTYLIGFSHVFDLKSWEIDVDGSKISSEDPLNQIMARQKNKNLIFINEDQIINDVKSQLPDANQVTVKKIFPQKIKIEIEKYTIVANMVDVVNGVQKKFLVNSAGFLADENTENPDLPYIKTQSESAFSVHSTVISQDRLDYILKAIGLFQEKFSLKILDAEYMAREREIHLLTEKNFMVWIDMEKDLNAQLDKLKKALPKLNIYNTPLEYIDLRISGTDNEKVIFKRRK